MPLSRQSDSIRKSQDQLSYKSSSRSVTFLSKPLVEYESASSSSSGESSPSPDSHSTAKKARSYKRTITVKSSVISNSQSTVRSLKDSAGKTETHQSRRQKGEINSSRKSTQPLSHCDPTKLSKTANQTKPKTKSKNSNKQAKSRVSSLEEATKRERRLTTSAKAITKQKSRKHKSARSSSSSDSDSENKMDRRLPPHPHDPYNFRSYTLRSPGAGQYPKHGAYPQGAHPESWPPPHLDRDRYRSPPHPYPIHRSPGYGHPLVRRSVSPPRMSPHRYRSSPRGRELYPDAQRSAAFHDMESSRMFAGHSPRNQNFNHEPRRFSPLK